MTVYRISTNTVRPLEDAPPGSFEWMPFEDDKNVLTVEVATAAELVREVKAAVLIHFDLFPEATACKPYADKVRGGRHVTRGKAVCERLPMILRDTVTDTSAFEISGVYA